MARRSRRSDDDTLHLLCGDLNRDMHGNPHNVSDPSLELKHARDIIRLKREDSQPLQVQPVPWLTRHVRVQREVTSRSYKISYVHCSGMKRGHIQRTRRVCSIVDLEEAPSSLSEDVNVASRTRRSSFYLFILSRRAARRFVQCRHRQRHW